MRAARVGLRALLALLIVAPAGSAQAFEPAAAGPQTPRPAEASVTAPPARACPVDCLPTRLPVPGWRARAGVAGPALVSAHPGGDYDRAPGASAVSGAQAESAAAGPRWRPALLATGALAVGGALLAYWSTEQGDQAYERYLRSAGVERQARALADAEDHDRRAGAGFLLMEAGLALSAYLVFF